MDNTYVVSFGNSRKYRITASEDGASALFRNLEHKVRSYVERRYPALPAEKYYSAITVERVDPMFVADLEEYSTAALDDFKNTIDREVADYESLEEIDSNAPWSDIN